jgi:excisionase family DNA binding protein
MLFFLDAREKNGIIGLAMNTNIFRTYKPLPNGRIAESPFDPEDRLFSIATVAELCSVQEKFIRDAIRRGELRVIILGPKAHRIRWSELQRWWKSRQEKGLIGGKWD